MFIHPDTVCQTARMDYADRVRASACARLAGEVAGARQPGGPVRAARGVAGGVLLAVGQRLRGGRRAELAGRLVLGTPDAGQ